MFIPYSNILYFLTYFRYLIHSYHLKDEILIFYNIKLDLITEFEIKQWNMAWTIIVY